MIRQKEMKGRANEKANTSNGVEREKTDEKVFSQFYNPNAKE